MPRDGNRMATAAQYRRARGIDPRRSQQPRSRRQLDRIEEWKAAFSAVDALKRLAAGAYWLQAVRVFQSAVTGELELEAQVAWDGAGASLPPRIGDLTVRVRCLEPANQPTP